MGSVIGGLIGLGEDGEAGMEAGAIAGAERAAEGFTPLGEPGDCDILEDIPNGNAAGLLHWAVPLRDAIARAGGYRISDVFISPLDLVEAVLHHRGGARPAARHGHQWCHSLNRRPPLEILARTGR